MAYQLLVKGNRHEAAKAAAARNIPFVFSSERERDGIFETTGFTPSYADAARWFGERGELVIGYGYAKGSCIHFCEAIDTPKLKSKGSPVFFCIMRGLRGGYMPDEASHYAVRSRGAFETALIGEVEFNELKWIGEPAKCVAAAWDHVQRGSLELCVATGDTEAYGLTVSQSNARDYLAHCRERRQA